MFEIRLRRIDDFHAVGSMPDEEVLPLSLRECESQLVGSYIKYPTSPPRFLPQEPYGGDFGIVIYLHDKPTTK